MSCPSFWSSVIPAIIFCIFASSARGTPSVAMPWLSLLGETGVVAAFSVATGVGVDAGELSISVNEPVQLESRITAQHITTTKRLYLVFRCFRVDRSICIKRLHDIDLDMYIYQQKYHPSIDNERHKSSGSNLGLANSDKLPFSRSW